MRSLLERIQAKEEDLLIEEQICFVQECKSAFEVNQIRKIAEIARKKRETERARNTGDVKAILALRKEIMVLEQELAIIKEEFDQLFPAE